MRTKEELHLGVAGLLRDLREKQGLSKNRMAEFLGINKKTWYAWEDGTSCPSVVDFIAAFDACDRPIMRPLLDMLHPETYADITDQSDITKVRQAVSQFFLNAAPDHMIRICMYLFAGSHGSEITAQLEEFCALDHLQLEQRYMIAEQIYMFFLMAQHRGELIETDDVMPNMQTWAAALKEGQKAAYGRLRSYSTANK